VLLHLTCWHVASVAAAVPPPPPKPHDIVSNWNAGCTFNLTGHGPRLTYPYCNSSLPLDERLRDLLEVGLTGPSYPPTLAVNRAGVSVTAVQRVSFLFC
jgi:hypothetical protein